MKYIFSIVFLFSISFANAQISEDLILLLESGTQTEMTNVTNPQEGQILYNTTDKNIYFFNGNLWTKITPIVVSTDSGNKITSGNDGGAYIGPTVYTGYFIISTSGNQNVTGIPFQPSQVTFVANANIESTDIDNDNGVGNNDKGINNSFGTMNGFARNDNGSIIQQVIYIGGSGNSINDISRYASSSNCIGIRYGDQNGKDLGKITATLTSFNSDGFAINVTYTNGTVTNNGGNVHPTDVLNESVLVLYTAYK